MKGHKVIIPSPCALPRHLISPNNYHMARNCRLKGCSEISAYQVKPFASDWASRMCKLPVIIEVEMG